MVPPPISKELLPETGQGTIHEHNKYLNIKYANNENYYFILLITCGANTSGAGSQVVRGNHSRKERSQQQQLHFDLKNNN